MGNNSGCLLKISVIIFCSYMASSSPSCKLNISADKVDLTTLFILFATQLSGQTHPVGFIKKIMCAPSLPIPSKFA